MARRAKGAAPDAAKVAQAAACFNLDALGVAAAIGARVWFVPGQKRAEVRYVPGEMRLYVAPADDTQAVLGLAEVVIELGRLPADDAWRGRFAAEFVSARRRSPVAANGAA